MIVRKLKRVILWVAIIALIAAVVVAFVKIGRIDKTKDVGALSYSIGTINDTDGKDEKSDNALRTKHLSVDKFNKIEIKDNADVTYRIFYYNADKEFIGKTDALSADTTELAKTQTVASATENVKYFRVVITVTDTDKTVNVFNKGGYVKQVTVTLNK